MHLCNKKELCTNVHVWLVRMYPGAVGTVGGQPARSLHCHIKYKLFCVIPCLTAPDGYSDVKSTKPNMMTTIPPTIFFFHFYHEFRFFFKFKLVGMFVFIAEEKRLDDMDARLKTPAFFIARF